MPTSTAPATSRPAAEPSLEGAIAAAYREPAALAASSKTVTKWKPFRTIVKFHGTENPFREQCKEVLFGINNVPVRIRLKPYAG